MIELESTNESRAARLHRESIVIDTLWGGTMDGSLFSQTMLERMDELLQREVAYEVILSEMNRMQMEAVIREELPAYWQWWDASGVDVASVTIGSHGRIPFSFENAVRDIALWTRLFDALNVLIKVTKAADIERAKETSKRGVILNFQNTFQIGQDLGNLDFFYNLGIRIMQLTYNHRNFVGNGCLERHDDGLSYFGLNVIESMNHLGILIDLSHCGPRTTLDAIEASTTPVAVTHSFAKALSSHDRGKTDEAILALGQKGGYFGVMVVPWFITSATQPTLEHFVEHVDYVVRMIGVEHVGIGTDFGSVPPQALQNLETEAARRLGGWRPEHRYDWRVTLNGYASSKDTPNITRSLIARGYSNEDIRGMLGGNFLRLFRQVVG